MSSCLVKKIHISHVGHLLVRKDMAIFEGALWRHSEICYRPTVTL